MRAGKLVTEGKNTKKGAALAIVGIAGAAVLIGAGCSSATDGAGAAANGAGPQSNAGSASYKDGTYEALGDYRSPGGPEQIDVTLTLKNNIVTDAKVVSKAFRPNSMHYQGLFISGVKDQVVGKNINQIKLTWVSGSSLTPRGFNDALAKIKSQAAS